MRSEYSVLGVNRQLKPMPGPEMEMALGHLLYHNRAEPSAPDVFETILERKDYKVRLADSNGQRSEVRMLVNRMYSWRGYKVMPTDKWEDRANQITLEASTADQLFSTLTVTLDSQSGLAVDDLYGDKSRILRRQVPRLCEFTRLAADPRYSSKEALASLFHLAYIYARLIHGASDALIEVNPRHVGFYRRMLGFVDAGPERMCPRVQAPAVLMHLDLKYVAKQIAVYGGGYRPDGEHSLYPYFFSEHEQEGLVRRIRVSLENREPCGASASHKRRIRAAL